jgi:hypothetical protein
MKLSLENYLRDKIMENEKMYDYAVSTDTIRCWIDEYNSEKKYTEDDIKEAAYFFATYKMAANQDIFDKDIYAFIDYLNKQK